MMPRYREEYEMTPSSSLQQVSQDQLMAAWRVHEFGPPEVMRFEQILRPNPGPGEVLVKVEAAGVGLWDDWIRAGKSALPQPLPLTPGSDLSGEIIAVGSEVSDLRVGDQVYGITNP
jgi:NADPH:quinone reductase-like Zn-dependent oxidoreductase